jgi:SAM-dependent methyltransferase
MPVGSLFGRVDRAGGLGPRFQLARFAELNPMTTFLVHAVPSFRAAHLLRLMHPRTYRQAARLMFGEQKFNVIVDRVVKPVPLEAFRGVLETAVLEVDTAAIALWKRQYMPELASSSPLQKKILAFWSTFQLLNLQSSDDYIDVGGAQFNYLGNLRVRSRGIVDLEISRDMRQKLGPAVQYHQASAEALPYANESLSKISCHDAFTVFHANVDSRFIDEVQRTLRPGGRCAISQIFIGDRYVEVTSDFSFDNHFDRRAHFVIDPSATVVGCGYVRIYDMQAFADRVISRIDQTRFSATLVELRHGGQPAPDLNLRENRHVAAMNRPFRILLIERKA